MLEKTKNYLKKLADLRAFFGSLSNGVDKSQLKIK